MRALVGDFDREIAVGEPLHGDGERGQAAHHAALDIEPDDEAGDQDRRQRRDHQAVEAGADRGGGLFRGAPGKALRGRQHRLGAAADLAGERGIGTGDALQLGADGDQALPLREQALAPGRIAGGRTQHREELRRLLAPNRVVDALHAPADDAQVIAVIAGDADDLVFGDGADELVGEQADLRTPEAQLEHAAQQIDVLLDQPVQRVIGLRLAVPILDQAVEAGDHRRGPGRGVRHQRFRQIDD